MQLKFLFRLAKDRQIIPSASQTLHPEVECPDAWGNISHDANSAKNGCQLWHDMAFFHDHRHDTQLLSIFFF